MDNRIKKMVWNIIIAALCVVVVSGIIILKPWQDNKSVKENLLSLVAQEQQDGIEEALEHQYPRLEEVKVDQEGYSLELYNMTIEEGRFHFESKVVFPEKKVDSAKDSAKKQEVPKDPAKTPAEGNQIDLTKEETPKEVERMKGTYFKVFLVDAKDETIRKEVSSSYEAVPNKEENILVYKLDGILTSDDLKQIMRKSQKLVVDASFFDSDRDLVVPVPDEITRYPVHPFKEIVLNVSEKNWKPSVHHLINQEIPTEYGSIIVDELVVGPSQMTITTRNALERGYCLKGFEGGKMVASNGKVYELQRSYTFEDSPEGKMHFYFNPSNYFEQDKLQEYTFRFGNIILNDSRVEKLVLSRQGSYPQTHRVLGQDVVVERMHYDEASMMLELAISYNPEVISLDAYIEGSKSKVFSPAVVQEQTQVDPKTGKNELVQKKIVPAQLKFQVANQSEYTLSINHNDFYVNKSGELKIREQ